MSTRAPAAFATSAVSSVQLSATTTSSTSQPGGSQARRLRTQRAMPSRSSWAGTTTAMRRHGRPDVDRIRRGRSAAAVRSESSMVPGAVRVASGMPKRADMGRR